MHAVSIIHGARSYNDPPEWRPDWPNHLATYLLQMGYGPVEPFFWSGNVLDGFSSATARQYALHLDNLYRKLPGNTEDKLSIIGKSMGPMIAEKSIMLFPEILKKCPLAQLGTILRVATPDLRTHLCFPRGFEIVDIVSKSDGLYWATVMPLTLMSKFLLRCNVQPTIKKVIVLNNIRHRDFNQDVELNENDLGAKTSFSLFERCLRTTISRKDWL